jgi:hypothetical protein
VDRIALGGTLAGNTEALVGVMEKYIFTGMANHKSSFTGPSPARGLTFTSMNDPLSKVLWKMHKPPRKYLSQMAILSRVVAHLEGGT